MGARIARVVAVIVAVMTGGLPPAIGAATATAAAPWSLNVSAPSTAMAWTTVPVSVSVTPPSKASGRPVVLQVKSGNGFVTRDRARVDGSGRARFTVLNERASTVTYRVALIVGGGAPMVYSSPVTIRWVPLEYRVRLGCASTSSPIRVDIPCTIAVTPAVRVQGLAAVLQVMGRTTWVTIDSFRVPTSGTIATDVEGFEPGLGKYRVRLLRSGNLLTTSNTVSIAYSATR